MKNLLLLVAFALSMTSFIGCGGDDDAQLKAALDGQLLGNWSVISLIQDGEEQMDVLYESVTFNFQEIPAAQQTPESEYWVDIYYIDMPTGNTNILAPEYSVEDQKILLSAESALWGNEFEVLDIDDKNATLEVNYNSKSFVFELEKI